MDRGDRRKSIFSLLTFFSSPQASIVLCKYTTSPPRDKISSTIFPALPLRGSSRDVLHAFITNAHRLEVIQIFSIQLFYSDTKIGEIEVIIYINIYYKIFFTDAHMQKKFF